MKQGSGHNGPRTPRANTAAPRRGTPGASNQARLGEWHVSGRARFVNSETLGKRDTCRAPGIAAGRLHGSATTSRQCQKEAGEGIATEELFVVKS